MGEKVFNHSGVNVVDVGKPTHPAIKLPQPEEIPIYQEFGNTILIVSSQPSPAIRGGGTRIKQRIDQAFEALKPLRIG